MAGYSNEEYLALLKGDLYQKYLGSDSSDVEDLNIVGDFTPEMLAQLREQKRDKRMKGYKAELKTRVEDAMLKGVVKNEGKDNEGFVDRVVEKGTWETWETFHSGERREVAAVDCPSCREPECVCDEEEAPQEGNQEVIYRDATGKQVTRQEWEDLRQIDPVTGKKRRVQKEHKQQEVVSWNKGIANMKEDEERKAYEESVINESFQRNNYTDTYDQELRDEIREEDPLAFMFKNEKIDSNKGTKIRPKALFTAPPNRFTIPAGYRWDGVVRGTNYEEKFLTAKSLREDREAAWKEQRREWSE